MSAWRSLENAEAPTGGRMGLAASWIGVKGQSTAAVLESLGLVETGEIDVEGAAHLVCAEFPGWVIVLCNDLDFATPRRMALLSAGGEVVGCEMSEITMHSAVHGYSAGERRWSVTHDPDRGARHLDIGGSPPLKLAGIREALTSEQTRQGSEHVDHFFETPIALSAVLSGFRPDEGVPPPGTVFKVVEHKRAGRAGQRQATIRRLGEDLGASIRRDLFSLAEKLGFEPALRHPAFYKYYPRGASTGFIRLRGEWSESLEFGWRLREGAPSLAIHFFVRRGDAPRGGSPGVAYSPPKPMSLLERFLGRKQEPGEAIREAVEEGRHLLTAVDRHLREGAQHPRIRPAAYWDER